MSLMPGGSAYQVLSVGERRQARQLAKPGSIEGDSMDNGSRLSRGAISWLRWLTGVYSVIAVALLCGGFLLLANSGMAGVPVLILAAFDGAYAVRCAARSVLMTRSLPTLTT